MSRDIAAEDEKVALWDRRAVSETRHIFRWAVIKSHDSARYTRSHLLALPTRPGHEGHVHHHSGFLDRHVAVLLSLLYFGR